MARYPMLAVTLVAAAAFTGPALAQQDAAAPAATNVPAPTTGTQTDTAVQPVAPDTAETHAIGTPIDGTAALNAIQGADDSARQIGTIKAVSDVHVVHLSDIQGADSAALKDAVTKNSAGIADLRAAIGATDALSAKLKQASVDPASVVAARIEADGAVTVFVE